MVDVLLSRQNLRPPPRPLPSPLHQSLSDSNRTSEIGKGNLDEGRVKGGGGGGEGGGGGGTRGKGGGGGEGGKNNPSVIRFS